MKAKLVLAAFSLIIIGCNKKENLDEVNSTLNDTTVHVVDEHTSRTSLDYEGYYSGVTPCADCEGIETSLQLEDDKNYVLKMKYLGKKDTKVYEQRGLYSWNDAGSTIILEGIKNGPTHYIVGENYIIQLDLQGNKIEGNLAEKYVLTKSDAPVAQSISVKSTTKTYSILGIKWQLIELNGKPVENKNNSTKEMFLQINAENRYEAFAGCNNMMGEFELKEDALRIKFTKGASTKMGCSDMTIEQEFAEMLEKVDNYNINGNNLSFNKARMAPLARFEAIK